MTRIRAFVGHSFADEDAALVRKFTDYFDALKRGTLDFDWVHATEARTEVVSAKVLELIEGKNLFIGICTRNERVAKNREFRPSLIGKRLTVDQKELDWKTSDWIIQEIGLAFGRGMNLLLLQEQGVRPPGGLQGNTEYIPFDRNFPEQSFQKIVEMISSLEPEKGISGEARSGEAIPPVQTDDSKETSTGDLCVPEASSDLSEYKHQFVLGLAHKDSEHASKVSEAYLSTLGPEDHDATGDWKSFCELLKLKWTEHGNLAALARLCNDYRKNPLVHERAAMGYLHFDDLAKAQVHFRTAIEFYVDHNRKIELLGELALIAQQQGSNVELLKIIADMRDLVDGPETEDTLLEKLATLKIWYRDDVLKAAMLERELSIDPTNTAKRFQLAYLHSDTDNDALSMFHYEKIPENDRDAMTWNNLGVTYRHFSLNSKSVGAYRKSAEKDESLAMSNLAELFMNSGFLSEAEDILQRAQKVPNCHDNVASALVRLKKMPAVEAKTHDDKLKGVKAKSDFLSHVGEHLWLSAPESVPDRMTDSDCELSVAIDGGNFVATGTFEKNKDTLVNALTSSTSPIQTENYTVEYIGRIIGKVAIGERTKKTKNSGRVASSLLGVGGVSPRFIIVLPDGAKKVRGMIGNELVDFSFVDRKVE